MLRIGITGQKEKNKALRIGTKVKNNEKGFRIGIRVKDTNKG